LESEHAETWLAELNRNVRAGEPREVVRAAAYGLSYQVKLGDLDLVDADRAYALLEMVSDPLLVSSFESTYSAVLGLAARYAEAERVACGFLDTIHRYRLDFARAYALCAESLACAGLRQWARAETSAREAIAIADAARDGHAKQLCVSHLTRVLTQLGRHREAVDLEFPILRRPLPSAQAEGVGWRALALASLGQVGRARELAASVDGLSKAVEPAVLMSATRAICALKAHDRDAVERILALEDTAFRRGALDLLVTAYRSVPELLSVLMRASADKEALRSLIRSSGDQDLAEFLGHPISVPSNPRSSLSPRERDVYDLLTQGLTNREIAKLLFIEESTVKVHAHHIYDKLGVRSRTALTVHAMLERSDQATSATEEVSSDSAPE
jgi:DNA-binding NarL/FixJ family response regulator